VSYIILAKATVDFAFWFFESRELGGEGWQYYARDFRDVNSCGVPDSIYLPMRCA
jgi:hypothetical protein